MLTYRICRQPFKALDGEGARQYGGRWNQPGQPMIYTSGTAALAALELLVHLEPSEAPDDLVLLTIDIPDNVPGERLDLTRLPRNWARTPGDAASRELGSAWLTSNATLFLMVPSAPIPEEYNVLLNPLHPDFARVRVVAERPFRFDPRL